jgi:hypothetical protein
MNGAGKQMKWGILTALSAAVLAGCSAGRSWNLPGQSTAAAAAPLPSNVVVVRGPGYWPDCEGFVDRLNQQGTQAAVIHGWDANRTAERLAAARQPSAATTPLVLVGYGRGANDAIRLTRRLQKHGVTVNTLILMETASQDSVPSNVLSCLNIYKSSEADEWIPVFRGLPVTVESARTELVNYNLRYHDDVVDAEELNHFTVCRDPTVLAMIAAKVRGALAPPAAPDGSDELSPAQVAERR